MAKRGIRSYRLIANSRFRPMTYDEILSPALMQTQAHQALEAQYADLASKANELEKKLDANRDKVSRATYEKYMSDLDSIATKLTKFGLTQGSNRDALAANSEYHKRIIPIIEGYNRRAEAERQQQAMLAQDPTRLFNRLASELSVDDFVADQTLDVISQNYSGAMITKQVADQAVGVIRWAKKNGGLHSLGIPYKYEQEFQTAYSPEEVYNTMHNMMKDPEAVPFLKQVVNQVMQSTGISKWSSVNGDENSYNWKRGMNYALEGLPAFIGTRTWKTYDDSYNMQLSLMKQRPSGSGSGTPPDIRGGNANWNPMFSASEIWGHNNFKEMVNKGLIRKGENGKYELTDEGYKKARESFDRVRSGNASNWFGKNINTLDALFYEDGAIGQKESHSNGPKVNLKQTMNREELNAKLNNIWGQVSGENDAYRINRVDHYLDKDMSDKLKRAYINAGVSLSPAKYLNAAEGYQYGSAENPNDMEDVDWEKWSPTNIYDNKFGSFVVLQDAEGNRREYRRPSGVNTKVESAIDYNNQRIWELQSILANGYMPKQNESGDDWLRDKNGNLVYSDTKLTPNSRAAIEESMERHASANTVLYPNIPATWGQKTSDYKVNRAADTYADTEFAPLYNGGIGGNTGSYLDLLDDDYYYEQQ